MLSTMCMGLVFLCYFARNSEGFGLPVSTFSKAMEQLNTLDPMKNVYLDFDKTIIVNGYSEVVRNGYCQEEYPECAPFNVSDDKALVTTIKEGKKMNNGAVFSVSNADNTELIESFGGADRLETIKSFLEELKTNNATVKIVSTSWFPITENQWQVYLFYVSNELELGFLKDDILTVADPGPGLSADKGAKIQKDQKDAGGNGNYLKQAIFADDSWGNIKSSRNVCQTLYINERKGLDVEDREYVLSSVKYGKGEKPVMEG